MVALLLVFVVLIPLPAQATPSPDTSTVLQSIEAARADGDLDRVRSLLVRFDTLAPPPEAALTSRVYEEAARAAISVGRDVDALHRLRIAVRTASSRPISERRTLLRTAGLVATASGEYPLAREFIGQALALTNGPALTTTRADLTLLSSLRIVRQTFDEGSGDLSDVPMLLDDVRRSVRALPDSIAAPFRARAAAHRATYLFIRQQDEEARSRAESLLASEDETAPPVARSLAHEVMARTHLRAGRFDRAYQHLDDAELALRASDRIGDRAPLLHLRVATAVQAKEPETALVTLRRLRILGEPGGRHYLSRASILVFNYLPPPLDPWWPWILAASLALVGAAAAYAFRDTGIRPASERGLDALSIPDVDELLEADVDVGADSKDDAPDASKRRSDVPPPPGVPRPPRTAAGGSASAAAGVDEGASAADAPSSSGQERMQLYDADGESLGTMPVPRPLRRATTTRFVAVEIDDRILIVEQASTSTDRGVERVDGGGFVQHDLPTPVSGLIVATLSR